MPTYDRYMGILQCKNLPQAPSLCLLEFSLGRFAAAASYRYKLTNTYRVSAASGQWCSPDQERVQPEEEHHVEDEAADHSDHIVAA